MTIFSVTTVPGLSDVVVRFMAGRHAAMLDIWRRYPYISDAEDARTDRWACMSASRAFTKLANQMRPGSAFTVRGDDAEAAFLGEHFWSVFTPADWGGVPVAVDFTARQFHNLDGTAGQEALRVSWPLLWKASLDHPVAGRFGKVESL